MKPAPLKTCSRINGIAFVEVEDWETARRMLPSPTPHGPLAQLLEQPFKAVIFVEQSLHDEALSLLNRTGKACTRCSGFPDMADLGVTMTYGIFEDESVW
jgi:hypothetical protein